MPHEKFFLKPAFKTDFVMDVGEEVGSNENEQLEMGDFVIDRNQERAIKKQEDIF